jgi:anti-sigma regulatory factor (Ser/Thr protein kinase)
MPRSSSPTSPATRPSKPVPDQIELRFTSDPANLAPTREAVEQLCLAGGLDATATGEVGLCVNEALANVMRHAYGGATDRPIELAAKWQNESLLVTIRDWGSGINPQAQPEKKHNPLKPGGLGLICLRKLMDEVTFTPQPDGMLLTMTKQKKDVTGH